MYLYIMSYYYCFKLKRMLSVKYVCKNSYFWTTKNYTGRYRSCATAISGFL